MLQSTTTQSYYYATTTRQTSSNLRFHSSFPFSTIYRLPRPVLPSSLYYQVHLGCIPCHRINNSLSYCIKEFLLSVAGRLVLARRCSTARPRRAHLRTASALPEPIMHPLPPFYPIKLRIAKKIRRQFDM